jgi:hypothetical protein
MLAGSVSARTVPPQVLASRHISRSSAPVGFTDGLAIDADDEAKLDDVTTNTGVVSAPVLRTQQAAMSAPALYGKSQVAGSLPVKTYEKTLPWISVDPVPVLQVPCTLQPAGAVRSPSTPPWELIATARTCPEANPAGLVTVSGEAESSAYQSIEATSADTA